MAISRDQVTSVIDGILAKGLDPLGAEIFQMARAKNINMQTATELAQHAGTLSQARGKTADEVATNIWDAFKVTLYAELNNVGIHYPDQRHNQLQAGWAALNTAISRARGAGLNATSSVGSLLGGNSGLSGGSIAVTAPATEAAGLNVTSSVPVSGFSAVTTPQTQPPLQVPPSEPQVVTPVVEAAPVVAPQPAAKTIDPFVSVLKSTIMEKYEDHELRAAGAMTAVQANQAIKKSPYYETRKWGELVSEIFKANGKEVVHYKGAGIVVRAHDDSASFMMPNSDTALEIVSAHQTIVERIRGYQAEGADVEPLLDKVIKDVQALITLAERTRAGAQSIIDNNKGDTDNVTEIEMIRFASIYRTVLDRTIYNAIAHVTNRGSYVPTVNGVRFNVDASEVAWFRDVLLPRTLGENGLTTEPDYFIEVMRVIANSIYKMHVQLLEGQNDVIEIIDSRIVIHIAAKYPDAKMSNVIDSRSLGNMADPLITIYETISREAPRTNVILVMPAGTYHLISNGDVTAPVYR